MKSTKTIRKLKSPLARDLARLARDFNKLKHRCDSLADKVETQAFELRAAQKELNALHSGMMPQSKALESAKGIAELFTDEKEAN